MMSFDRRVRVALLIALRTISVAAIHAGLGALVAAVLLPSSRPDATLAWLDSLRAMAWGLGLTLLPGSIGMLILMPSHTNILHRAEPGEDAAFPQGLRLLMVGLAVVTAIVALPITAWWRESLAMLERVAGTGPDPMGLRAIPGAVLLSMPIIASAGALSFALASGLVLLVRPRLASRVLWGCASLQAGLAIGGAYALHRLVSLGSQAAALLASSPDMVATAAELEGWISRQRTLGGSVTLGLICILSGYVAAAAAASWLATPRGIQQTTSPPLEPQGLPAAPAIPPGDGAQAEPHPAPSAAASAFDRSTFVVQPRVTFASFLSKRHAEYDIWAYGDARGGRIGFSFSWATGVIKQEPAGPDVVAIRIRSGGWLSRMYDVADLSTGALLATLSPDKPDWVVLDPMGRPIARVQAETRIGQHRYVARVAGAEICRYSWYLGSRGALNPELEIEFAPDADGRLDRAVAVALGPLLEQQARLSAHPR